MTQSHWQLVRNGSVVVGSVAAATILRAGIDAVLHEPIEYTTFYLAVMVSALYGGLYWGLASTALAAGAAMLWLPSLGQLASHEPSDLAELLLFLITSVLIVWMSHNMREHRRQAEASAEERHRLLIAEQAARREAERLNHAKDDFLATISHELRTPLQSILGWTQMLREFSMDPTETDLATASIERSVRIQSQLINDLLDLSRIVMGKLRLELRPLSLADTVRAAVQTVYPAAQAKGVNLRVESDVSGAVLGDADRLQQVAWNLLSNAIKFTPPGGVVQTIVSQTASGVELVVRDTGDGIDAASLPRVFERFHQNKNGLERDGLGLGLAIVKELVELHGGTIRAHSAGKGQGTEFRVALPLNTTALAKAPADDSSVAAEPVAADKTPAQPVLGNALAAARRTICTPRNHVSSAH